MTPRARHVLLVAATTGYQIRSFGAAAARAGVRLTLASDRCNHLTDPWRDGAVPIRFQDAGASAAAVQAALASNPVHGVLAVGDRPAVLAASLARVLGVPGNPRAAAAASGNKLVSRQVFRDAGLRVPHFELMPVAIDPATRARDFVYPVVLKPLTLSGSRGVIRADTPAQFEAAFNRIVTLLQVANALDAGHDRHAHLLVESFIPGREFAVEGVLSQGALQCLAIFDKPDPLDGPFFEETIYVTPSRALPDEQTAIAEAVSTAAQALGLRHGPVHAECRVNSDGVFVLEVAARPIGGLCAKALSFRGPSGVVASLEEVLVRHAAGEDVRGYAREPLASGVMMLPIPRRGVLRAVDGVEAARAVTGIDEVRITAKLDALLIPLPEGRSYLGFLFAHGATPADVETSLREAHGRLAFRMDRAIDLAEPGSDGPMGVER